MLTDNQELKLAFDFVQYTNKNIFLTGKAGTGKTTFLHRLKEQSPKRMVVVAPTGVAAINAGGVTVHSLFQLSLGPYLPEYQQANDNFQLFRFNKEKINILRSLDLLVIDEISMVRADLLDGVDAVLRRFRDRTQPFGGVQLLMIGDLQQLSPVIKDEEWSLLQPHYKTPYFFSSHALQKTDYIGIELKTVYRQSDDTFIAILNKIRENNMDQPTLDALNKRYIPGFSDGQTEGYITLTTHNYQAQRMNEVKISQLSTKPYTFTAIIEGEFPEHAYPTNHQLTLKEGAQVMFVKNDASPEKLFFNGKIGKIVSISREEIIVMCAGDSQPITVEQAIWENMRYEISEETKEIKETKIGSFTQYPLKTAWAITIHKSQGLTFEHAIIDANASFAHGQVYVALSRCRTLEGMVLTAPLSERSIINDTTVKQFTSEIDENKPTNDLLQHARLEYQQYLLLELFDFLRVQRWIYLIQKVYTDNPGAIPPTTGKTVEKMVLEFRTEVVTVAEKFKAQIQNLLKDGIENNEVLQDRIKKGAAYFLGKTQAIIIEFIEDLSIETDNKQVRKQWTDYYQKLQEEIEVKVACLVDALNGFYVKNYLKVKAKTMLAESQKIKKIKKEKGKATSGASPASSGIIHPKLFETLRNWRAKKAAELAMPVYIVLQQKTLLDLLEKLPVNSKELLQINGFGEKKLKQFGSEVLKIIQDFREKNGMKTGKELEF
ncbi:MAG: HRDC domain-containing protein [Dysgonamonadaceae bacterium]|jgi:GTPase SAR1 family protein|nr:HRDC domain-containing protein [Dysgonamonadaceae bacterium]